MSTNREWTSRQVRETFLSFFEARGHRRVASSSLVPAEDPTLLFTNAGMNQFKDVFLGREARDYTRAASSQKCVRAGGKHNDLDNVGYTARHQTFFEMLGNFSFGDYFKKEAIELAWELMTSPTFYGIDPSRLWATVYTDDDEAAALWERHLPKDRIARFGEKDNFWSMGDTGPCGPCTELHYDQGPEVPGDDRPNGAGDRVMEIWNLVFMQYDRDAAGTLNPLPKPSVDTGAGLERITAILEGKNNNYDTDLFTPLIRRVEEISGRRYAGGMAVEDAPFRVVADHARAATMLLWDGVVPSNEGRGYVLRRILRRAMRYGRRLGVERAFLFELVPVVAELFDNTHFFPHDPAYAPRFRAIAATIADEEERFAKTVLAGADRVGEAISELRRRGETALTGETVFRFYDTHGIPLELIEELAQDEGVGVDRAGFEVEMAAARKRSKASSKFQAGESLIPEELVESGFATEFRGYPEDDFIVLPSAPVLALYRIGDGGATVVRVDELPEGSEGFLIPSRTVFYPEGGGQVTDIGRVVGSAGEAEVVEARKGVNGRFVQHRVKVVKGKLTAGESVRMEVPEWTRRKTQANHTGTHLLHAALRKVLGESARQMGSLVSPERLRFDYAAARPTTREEIEEIERLVNEAILRDLPVSKVVTSMDDAKEKGAVMFFGEKYGERVRVVDVPGVSTELCGGCHVARTGEIGALKVVSDRGLAAGVRRMEALTSLNLVERLRRDEDVLGELSESMQVPPDEIPAKWREVSARLKEQEKELARLRVAAATSASRSGSGEGTASDGDGVVEIHGVKVLSRRVPSLPMNELRNLADTFRGKLRSGIVLLGTESEGKATLLAAVTPDLSSRVTAHELAQTMAPIVGGKGGGKPDLAQAGGKDPSQIDAALAAAVSRVRERLATPQ